MKGVVIVSPCYLYTGMKTSFIAECVTRAVGVSKLYVIHLMIWFRAVYFSMFSTWRHNKIQPSLARKYLWAHQALCLAPHPPPPVCGVCVCVRASARAYVPIPHIRTCMHSPW
jgi:hypothetical protein